MPRRTGRRAAGPAGYDESWIARSRISRRCKPPSTGKTSEPVPCPVLAFLIRRRNLRGSGRCPVRAFKEMSRPSTFRSTRTPGTNVGSPTGRESYGDGGPVVVAGVTTCQGGRESRPQGEAGQVIGHPNPGRYAQCRAPQRCWMSCVSAEHAHVAVTGEPGAVNAARPVRTGGRWKRAWSQEPRQRPTGAMPLRRTTRGARTALHTFGVALLGCVNEGGRRAAYSGEHAGARPHTVRLRR